MQERFASIIASCTDGNGVVDKTKLLELLRLSPEDPVTLIFDVLIANIDISSSISESGRRLLSQAEEIGARQEKHGELLLSEMRSMPLKIDRLLEVSSGKIFSSLDEMRSIAQTLNEQSNYNSLEAKKISLKSAILYFLIGFVSASLVALVVFYKINF